MTMIMIMTQYQMMYIILSNHHSIQILSAVKKALQVFTLMKSSRYRTQGQLPHLNRHFKNAYERWVSHFVCIS